MRFLKRAFVILILLLAAAAALGIFVVRRSFPVLDGEIHIQGLNAPVKIYRDDHGIPNIYAASQHDLFFAQGYIHAQDRFWQMDFWRHTGSGRLSELFGAPQVKTDRVLRTMGWARVSREELKHSDPISLAILKSYAEGVNAFLADHHGSRLSLEYVLLGLIRRGYVPEPWEPLHSVTWGKAMSWDLGMNLTAEISRSVLEKKLGEQHVQELYPPYPADRPLILPSSQAVIKPQPQQTLPQVADLLARWMSEIPPERDGVGSNNWVVSGALTSTGKPLLANDPHLGEQMPSIWYQVGLHCEPRTADCDYDVTGFSFAGVPGVIIGHNNRIAWGFTNVGPDVQDLFIEKTNPQNPDQYEFNGQWLDMQKIPETIQVAGGAPQTITVRLTRHGPVMSDAYNALADFDKRSSANLPDHFVIALKWTALEPSVTFPAIWKMNLAHNWEEFRTSASSFDVPSQNMIYADVDGNIGYQVPGRIPIRNAGNGLHPAPGWTGEYDWKGYIPFDQLPHAFKPPEGYIATANNAVTGPEYPYFIGADWDYGSRAQCIVDLIEHNRGHISVDFIKRMQGDDRNLNAETLTPYILMLPISNVRLLKARKVLEGWNFQQSMDSPAAALFECFWRHLLDFTFHDDLPKAAWPGGGNRWVEVVRRLATQPDNFWWDDHSTQKKETRDDMMMKAFSAAVDELETTQGVDPSAWRWGRMHTVTFVNETLGRSGFRPVEMLFNRGPFETSGDTAVINATAWYAPDGYEVTDLPSMRMIVDLGNMENSLAIHTTGESGHAYHRNYIDMADMWRRIEYLPLRFGKSAVQSSASHVLTLEP
ncbi:MAG TPA: penicillin acylase family protein [Acidobacteriota bacterium]|nr:penicillin acylase family protein [Acidobacteriota bacterium]